VIRAHRTLLVVLVLAATGSLSCATRTVATRPPPHFLANDFTPALPAPSLGAPLNDAARAWIDRTLASLSLRRRVAQMVMVWALGDYASTTDSSFAEMQRWITDDGVGGVVMSLGSPMEVAAKINDFQRLALKAGVPLLVASDLEPGLGRLEGGTFTPSFYTGGSATILPSNMALGATNREVNAEEAGRITGREAKAIGIHVAFAPVVDVNSNPANPVINTRSFGEDPETVARFSAAFIRAVQGEGVAATAKHFPGHGDTDVDSHLALPVVTSDRARLDAVELVPFRAAIAEHVAGVMTAHIALPAIGRDTTPATLVPGIVTGLLRETLGFRGLTVTDALSMEGVGRGYTVEQSAVLAVQAGADILLKPTDTRRAIDAVVAAVERGEIARERIDASVRSILWLKLRTGAVQHPLVALDSLRAVVGSAPHREAALRMAQEAVTLLRDERSLVPMHDDQPTLVLNYAGELDVEAGRTFTAELRRSLKRARVVRITPRTARAELDSLVRPPDRVIVATHVRTVEGEGRFSVAQQVAAWVDSISLTHAVTVAAFGNPYVIRDFPHVGSYLATYGRGPALEQAAASAIMGRAPIRGKSPISLPGFFRRGDGLVRPFAGSSEDRGDDSGDNGNYDSNGNSRSTEGADGDRIRADSLGAEGGRIRADSLGAEGGRIRADSLGRLLGDSLRAVLDKAVADGAFPGAFAVVGRRDGALAQYGAGHLDWAPSPVPDERTLWDLASLTKVVATTSALMQLVEQGRVELDAPVQRYLPNWTGPNKERVTVRRLLTHSSGLPAWRPIYKEADSPDIAMGLVYATPLDTLPGVRMVYSDLGAILLGEIVRVVSGERIDAYFAKHVAGPLGMSETSWLPSSALLGRIAPTEIDPWRQRHLRGEVHDENAFALGGVSAHAGLFSTARDLTRFARMCLNRGTLDGARIFEPATLDLFTTVQDSAFSNRALGWETPNGQNSAGHLMKRPAFGHTGFTGTSIWIDPAHDLFIILLTNRVNPTRANTRITRVRQQLADAVMQIFSAPRSMPR
jgi:beta-glucosidase-like glycosyl hydrolase/CubicO group peptidase (beta-lactamase class C family)